MINKTFSGGRTYAGAKATIEYLLNERVGEGTSSLLSGDSELTLAYIKYISRKNKWSWSSGVLTFSETLSDKIKKEIIDEWRNTFFCGLLPFEYNDLWINHEDKKRTELHYICPRLELSSGLSFNPYFVTRDFHKKDLFQEYINLKYHLTSFKDNQEITSRYDNKSWNNDISEMKKDMDREILSLIKEGIVNNQDEVIETMREVGFEIKHLGKESMVFTHAELVNNKGEEFNITMKGKQYGECYKDWESLEAEVRRESQTVGRGVPRDIIKIREELDSIIKQQAHTNRKQYEHKNRGYVITNRAEPLYQDGREYEQYRKSNSEKTLKDRSTRTRALSSHENSARGDIRELRNDLNTSKEQRGEDNYKREKTQKETIWRELRDDAIRTEIDRRVRERESIQRRIAKRVSQRDEYADARASKRLYDANQALDRRAKRRSIAKRKTETRRERRYSISFKKLKFTDEYYYQALRGELNRQRNRRIIAKVIRRLTRSISPLIDQCKQGFNLRNQAVKRELSRGYKSVLKSMKQRANKELESFKKQINLASFSSIFGYERDNLNSFNSMAVLKHDQEDKEIIVWKNRQTNQYQFFNPIDREDSGTIVEFIQSRTNKSSRELREIFKKWSKDPKDDESIFIKASTKEEMELSYYWLKLDKTASSYVSFKKLSSSNIKWLESQENVVFRQEEQAFYFKMHFLENIYGIMKMTENEQFLVEGSQRNIFSTGEVEKARQVVIIKDPLALLFYRELHNLDDTFYICTMGTDEENIAEGLLSLLKNKEEIPITLSFTNNDAGEKESLEIENILHTHHFFQVERQNPEKLTWEEDLSEKKRKQSLQSHQPSMRMRM